VAADETDQPGVLGNLPRSRPGQRSEKRGGAKRATAAAGAKPTVRARPAPKRAPAKTRKTPASARKPRAAAAPEPRERPAPRPAQTATDPIATAFRVAGKVAEVGLKTAGGILRRLPGR
jgi:hypothetical protein